MSLLASLLYLVLTSLVLFLGFLLLGVLRSVSLLRWRLDELEATTPRRVGRRGLELGRKAPDFSLPTSQGEVLGLQHWTARRLLLVFASFECESCRRIIPDLNRLQSQGKVEVLMVIILGAR